MGSDVMIRPAGRSDAERLAALHAARISEGFLPQLGVAFLARLYRRIVASPDGFATVAVLDGSVVGFVAGATDLGRVYKSFVVHDGLMAALGAAPHLLRSWRRVLETLRYPATTSDLPEAEILAVVVDAERAERGIGRRLVAASLEEFAAQGVQAVKVVAGADNAAALGLYARCGFVEVATIEVHAGATSAVLVWSAP
jgi:ribosomal protein S18 acetylase RimI-like enzyme